jgi:hypothetical protein
MSQAALVQPFPRNQMENPYVGPKPFEREDEYRFYGRTQESEQLVATIMGSPVTLLYAESGAGKTSLLRAKVILMLERLDDEDSGEESKRDVLRPARVSGGAKVGDGSSNIFTANVLNSIASKEELQGRTLTLTEYLRERPRSQPSAEPDKVVKVPPIKPLRVLIIDQFEELFTSGAEWWQHRQPFVQDLATALDEDRRLRLVIAMREEYVANMDAYAAVLPGALRTRVRLQRLREKSALEAITGPLKGTGVSFTPDAAEKLVRKLRAVPGSSDQQEILGEFVEPLHLQVVCSRIWQSLPDGEQEITDTMIGTHGDIEEALTDYYDQCIREVSEEAKIGEPSLRGWFERELITENKTRGIVFCGRDFVGSLRTSVAELIAKRYLIRAEFRGGGKWYELSHDRMIGPVLESGRRWRESQTTGKIVKRLEDAARQWSLTGGRGTLAGEELTELDAWLRSAEGRDYVMTKELKELVQASRLAAQQRQTRRIRLYLIAAVCAGIAGLLMIGGFWYFTRKAEHDSMVATLVQVAERQYRKGDHFEALLWSLKALRSVGDGKVPSPLRSVVVDASTKIGSEIWLRTKAPLENYTASADGHIVVTNSKEETCKWDLRVPGEIQSVCATSPSTGNVGFRPSFVSDDGTIVVLRVARPFFDNSFRDRPSTVVLDGTLKHTTFRTPDPLFVARKGHRIIVLKRHQAGMQLTTYDAAGRKMHEPVDVPPSASWEISPSGELAVFETLNDFVVVDLRRRTPITRIVAARSDEDVDSLSFSDDDSRLIIAREPFDSTSVTRLQVIDTTNWKEITIAPPANLHIAMFMANLDATQFIFLSGGRLIASPSQSIIGVIKHVDGATSVAKFTGTPVSFDTRGLLLSLNEPKGESRYIWWEPFADWRHYKTIRLDAEAKAVSVLGRGRGLAAIQNGAVRLLRFDAEAELALATNASTDALINRACRQLRWQPEHDLVKDICAGK